MMEKIDFCLINKTKTKLIHTHTAMAVVRVWLASVLKFEQSIFVLNIDIVETIIIN